MSATQESLWHCNCWFTSSILILYSPVLHFSDPSFCPFLTSEILLLGLQELTNKISVKFLYSQHLPWTEVFKLLLSLSSPVRTVLPSPETLSNVGIPSCICLITSTGGWVVTFLLLLFPDHSSSSCLKTLRCDYQAVWLYILVLIFVGVISQPLNHSLPWILKDVGSLLLLSWLAILVAYRLSF